jgi:hypothetical protein
MSNDELSFILTLKDFRKQKAVICVNCTGYLVETIEIDTFQDRLRRHYGRMIALIQRTLKLGICAKDQKSWKARLFSNSTKSLVVVMEEFLSSLRAEQIRRQQQKS